VNAVRALDDRARETPGRLAIVQPGRRASDRITFGELRTASIGLAAELRAAGVGAGDRVLLAVPRSIRLYVALAAILRLGAVPVVIDPGQGIGRARACLRLAWPSAVVGTRATLAFALALAPMIPELRGRARVAARLDRTRGPETVAGIDPGHPGLLTFTSGTTGEPAPVERSHELLIAQHEALDAVLGQRPGETALATLPIFVLAHLAAGVTSVLIDADIRRPGAIDPGPVLDQIERHRPSLIVASPTVLDRLARARAARPGAGHRLERLFTGGGPVFPDVLERLEPLTTDGRATVLYGSSEAEPIAHLERLEPTMGETIAAGGGLPVGRPVDRIDLRIVRDGPGAGHGRPVEPLTAAEVRARERPVGERGEIVVAGRHVTCGADRWHRTGDAGRLDADGRLWLLGRCGHRVRVGERTVHPLEVEAAVRAASGLPAALLPGETDGAAPRLVLEAGRGPLEPDRLERARASAATFGLTDLRRIRRLPVDARHAAKIDRSRLGAARLRAV